jgi:hypothetical protein
LNPRKRLSIKRAPLRLTLARYNINLDRGFEREKIGNAARRAYRRAELLTSPDAILRQRKFGGDAANSEGRVGNIFRTAKWCVVLGIVERSSINKLIR